MTAEDGTTSTAEAEAGFSKKLLPPLLLLVVGSLTATILAFGKVAISSGIPPLANAFWVAFGAGIILMVLSLRRRPKDFLVKARYGIIAGSVSVAFPTALVAIVITEIGSGMTSVVYAFPPLLTYLLSLPVGLDKPSLRRFAGIIMGLIGALIVVFPPDGPTINLWMALAMLIPISVACGNIYRTMAWPKGGQPMELAAMLQLGSAILLLAPMLIAGQGHWPLDFSTTAGQAVLAQMALTSVTYVLFFMLQKVGGPVYLSQLGYILVAVGLLIGWIAFGETYSSSVFLALGLIAGGLYLANRRTRT